MSIVNVNYITSRWGPCVILNCNILGTFYQSSVLQILVIAAVNFLTLSDATASNSSSINVHCLELSFIILFIVQVLCWIWRSMLSVFSTCRRVVVELLVRELLSEFMLSWPRWWRPHTSIGIITGCDAYNLILEKVALPNFCTLEALLLYYRPFHVWACRLASPI